MFSIYTHFSHDSVLQLFVESTIQAKHGRWSDIFVYSIPALIVMALWIVLQNMLSISVVLSLDSLVGNIIFR